MPCILQGTYKKEHDQSSTRGQVGGWEVEKAEIWAVWLGKSELEGRPWSLQVKKLRHMEGKGPTQGHE